MDLFPKFVDKEGNVCGVSGTRMIKKEDGTFVSRRCWEKFPAKKKTPAPKLTENCEAAVLLVKLWKLDLPSDLRKGIKGYHIARIAADLAASDPASYIASDNNTDVAFDKDIVVTAACDIAERLKKKYKWHDNEDYQHEFLRDTKTSERQAFADGIGPKLTELVGNLRDVDGNDCGHMRACVFVFVCVCVCAYVCGAKRTAQ
eukprot:TRINITY_DN3691_c0_g1_i1.p2 TRINITY_DN3691_c0_g1~~TRINITY_DN3691_c0_g1_i1.p2  ORF type:complete len:202 (+),score=50.95 TRINITY_DN3691_c0_g1_i1:824-1429(+)